LPSIINQVRRPHLASHLQSLIGFYAYSSATRPTVPTCSVSPSMSSLAW
jgi:hypothetical protein